MAKATRKLNDKEVVALFVKYLAIHFYPGLEIETIPDEHKSGDIDAIAGEFAIEHTSIDTIHNQSRDSVWFIKAIGSLEKELDGKLPFRLILTLPYEGIKTGQNWENVKTVLQNWILNESFMLSEGSHIISGILGLPFDFRAKKNTNAKSGLILSRYSPDITDFTTRLRKHLDRKVAKLASYKEKDKTTLLLVESNDIAFMNDGVMWDSLKSAYPEGLPTGIDNVWFVHTSMPENIEYFDMNTAFTR